MTEKELMMIKRDLQKRAKKMHLGKERTGAYVFGTLRRIRGNPAKIHPRIRDVLEYYGFYGTDEDGNKITNRDALQFLKRLYRKIPKNQRTLDGVEAAIVGHMKTLERAALRGNPRSCSEVYDDNWDDREMILVSEKTLKPACIGQKVKSFRGEYATLEGGRAPHKEGSTGKVWVKEAGSKSQREYYPSVYGLAWIPSVNVFPIDKVTQKPRYKLRGNPACMRSLQANGGKTKTWKLGEYASGGIIQAKVSGDGNAVAIRVLDYYTKEPLAMSMFRWPLDKFVAELYLNELTTSYYSNVILDWIASAAK